MRAIGILFLIAAGVPALLVGMVFASTPSSCVEREATTEDRPLLPTVDALLRQAAPSGGTLTLAVSEAQATALAARAVAAQGLPVSEVRVRFCPDRQTEVFGRVTLLGWPMDAQVRADIDASGAEARARVSTLRVGALPASLTSWLTDLVPGGASRDLPLPPGATVRIEDGRAVISGALRR